jgi:hypothetical protein
MTGFDSKRKMAQDRLDDDDIQVYAQPAQEPVDEAAIRADEREACAKVVEVIEARCIAKDVDDPPLKHIAEAIRARGNT